MKLSAPIYRLKRQARLLSRRQNLRLHKALDQIAINEGFASWSLLAAQMSHGSAAKNLLADFDHGDLVLLGARPGHGKTQLSLEIAIAAMNAGYRALFFSLEYNPIDIHNLFKEVGHAANNFRNSFALDTSDAICAEYIIGRLSSLPKKTVVVIDYLQLLDQRRANPELEAQIDALKSFVKARRMIMIFISQIDRSFDLSPEMSPSLDDVRLPNPLDLGLFAKSCFLNNGEIRVAH